MLYHEYYGDTYDRLYKLTDNICSTVQDLAEEDVRFNSGIVDRDFFADWLLENPDVSKYLDTFYDLYRRVYNDFGLNH